MFIGHRSSSMGIIQQRYSKFTENREKLQRFLGVSNYSIVGLLYAKRTQNIANDNLWSKIAKNGLIIYLKNLTS